MHSKTKHIPAIFAVAVLMAGLVGYAFASGRPIINVPQNNVVKGSLTIEDVNGVPITGAFSPFQTIKQNDIDVTDKIVRIRLATSFSIASESPIAGWHITGVGTLGVNGETTTPFYIDMTGTSASETDMPLLIRDCSTCSEPYENSLALSVLDMAKTEPNTYTGPLNVKLTLIQLKITATTTDGATAISYATPPEGVVLATMALTQEGDAVAPSVSVNNFTVTSGEVKLEEQ